MNSFYKVGANGFLTGDIDWVNDELVAILVSTNGTPAYSPNFETHAFISDIPVGSRIAQTTLEGRAAVKMAAISDDLTFLNVVGIPCQAIVIAKYTGDINTSSLICWIDEGSTFPVVPNSGNITIEWSVAGIFAI